jgi:hypothetical protein
MSAYRKTWSQIKNYIGRPIGLGGAHPDLLPMYNQACEALWAAGDWVGKFQIYRFKLTGDCHGNQYVTMPTQVEVIEMMQACQTAIGIRNQAFEFIENALGNLVTSNAIYGGTWAQSLSGDRSEVCTMLDIKAPSKRVKVYNSLPADNGNVIKLFGYDDNNNWIRTLQGAVYVDGEYLTLSSTTPPSTTNFFSQITGVQFTTTPRSGTVSITEVDTLNGNAERLLSTYEYDEEVPVYRRSVITGLGNSNCECITALCRMRYVQVRADTDYVQIGNIEAIQAYLMYIQKRDNGKFQDAETFRAMAIRTLNDELNQYKGVAPKKVVSFAKRELWGTSCNVM